MIELRWLPVADDHDGAILTAGLVPMVLQFRRVSDSLRHGQALDDWRDVPIAGAAADPRRRPS